MESSPWWRTRWRHVPLEASQRNRDHPPAALGTARCDTDKVVVLMLRSHTSSCRPYQWRRLVWLDERKAHTQELPRKVESRAHVDVYFPKLNYATIFLEALKSMITSPLPLSLLNRDRFLNLFYDPIDFNINVRSNLHLHILRVKDGSFVLEQLFKEMTNSMFGYVYSRKKYKELRSDETRLGEFLMKACSQFKTPDPNSGEGGELLLYSFLEGHLGAPKILSKMEIKTSSEHYSYGSDGIHVLEIAPNEYQLIFGESKMYADVKRAIKASFASLGKVKQEGFDYDTWLTESELLKEALESDQIKCLESILLPSSSVTSGTKVSNAFGVFVGFEIDVTDFPFEDHDDAQIEMHIRNLANNTISNEIETIKAEVTKLGLGAHHFHIYTLPFLKENVNGTIRGIEEVRYDIASRLSNKS